MYDQTNVTVSNMTMSNLDSPLSLENYCIDFICDHLEEICVLSMSLPKSSQLHKASSNEADKSFRRCEDKATPSPGEAMEDTNGTQEDNIVEDDEVDGEDDEDEAMETSETEDVVMPADLLALLRPGLRRSEELWKRDEVLRFPNEIFLPNELSEQLLENLCRRRRLNNLKLSLFDASSTRLRHVRICDASQLTQSGLKTLSKHRIVELECRGLTRATVGQLIDCLNSWTLANCRSLNVSRCTFVDHRKATILTSLCKFRQLTSLNVASTEFNKSSLDMIVNDLPNLESLDISCTKVTDISSLVNCKDKLKSLSMYGLKLPSSDTVVDILFELSELRHLDISDEKDDDHPFESGKLRVGDLLQKTGAWPNLVSLDISGKDNISLVDLHSFVSEHRRLRFIGLMLTEACKDKMFISQASIHNLTVTGSANEAQIMESLSRYLDRQHYVKKSLSYLFGLTQGLLLPRVDIIKLVLAAAAKYQTVFNIQMAATACLFNLSRIEIIHLLHPKILGQIVKVDLDAMETFPQYHQLQKNVLLTICNDRILQEVSFDKYRCARLVMDCLCAWQDNSMNRMSVAICSILAAKISTQETSQLGSQSRYMKKLLNIVRRKVDETCMDVTLKFTLSALWNLTDESPQTCNVFLQEGGMQLFLKVLQTFSESLCVKTKVLGLLNNIVEVKELRSRLMLNEFILQLRDLLRSKDIEVSYFAAGIAAHLTSSGSNEDGVWPVKNISRDELIQDLASIVDGWQNPESEMVAYRSFRPFFPLMGVDQVFAVQLWAVWAIHHVCSKNPKRYCPMLVEQGGDLLIMELFVNIKTHTSVAQLCRLVIDILADKKFLTLAMQDGLKSAKFDFNLMPHV